MGFDIAIGIVLLLGAVRGFKKGFARQILTLTSLILAFVFAKPLAERLAGPLAGPLEQFPEAVAESMVYTGSLLGLFLVVNLFGTLYLYVYRTRSLGVNAPSLQDRIVGVFVGVAVGGFIACVLISQVSRLPAMVRESDIVQTHFTGSRGVKLAMEYQISTRVWETPEVQRAYLHAGRLVEYFRPTNSSDDSRLSSAE